MMAMAAATLPRTRIHLFLVKHKGEWTVWELEDKLPPSTALELEPERSPSQQGVVNEKSPRLREQPELFPGLVMEVSANGEEIVTWPGPEVT